MTPSTAPIHAEDALQRALAGEALDVRVIYSTRTPGEDWSRLARRLIRELEDGAGPAEILGRASVLIASAGDEELRELALALLAFISRPDDERRADLVGELRLQDASLTIARERWPLPGALERICEDFSLGVDELAQHLGVKPATVRVWLEGRKLDSLPPGITRLAMAGFWMRQLGLSVSERRRWLCEPAEALAGDTPLRAVWNTSRHYALLPHVRECGRQAIAPPRQPDASHAGRSATTVLLGGELSDRAQAEREPTLEELRSLERSNLGWVEHAREMVQKLRKTPPQSDPKRIRRETAMLIATAQPSRWRSIAEHLLAFLECPDGEHAVSLADALEEQADGVESEQLRHDWALATSRVLAEFDLSEDELAQAAGVKPATVRRWLQGKAVPSCGSRLSDLAVAALHLRRGGFDREQRREWVHRKEPGLFGLSPLGTLRFLPTGRVSDIARVHARTGPLG